MALGCPPDLQSVAARRILGGPRWGDTRRRRQRRSCTRGAGGKVISAQFASTAGSLTAASPRQRMLHGLWYGRSIRLQLLVVFVLIDLLAALLSGTIAIWRARAQTSVEIATSVHLAELLVGD